MTTGQPVQDARHAIQWPDGRRTLLSINAFPLFDEAGAFDGMVATVEDITDRVLAEEALRESEQRFRQLADHIDEDFWIWDVAGERLLYISPAYEKIWGRSCESVYEDPKSFMQSIHPDDLKTVLATMEKSIQGEKIDIEHRIASHDGSFRWIWEHAYPIYDASGTCHRLVGFGEDITARKQMEEELHRSRYFLTSILDNAPMMIYATAPDHRHLLVNKAENLRKEIGRR
jgi:PAS domain S-box-containing protein